MDIEYRRNALTRAKILAVSDIPVTLTGKRVEVPIRKVSPILSVSRFSAVTSLSLFFPSLDVIVDFVKVINGAPVSSINPATLRNPECLEEYARLGEAMRKEQGM